MCIKSYPHQHINLHIHGPNLAIALCLHSFIFELKVFEQVEFDLHWSRVEMGSKREMLHLISEVFINMSTL